MDSFFQKKRIILLFVFLIFQICFHSVNAQSYGLRFKGYDVVLDERTELNLTPNGFLKFQDEFELSFDFKVTPIQPNSYKGFFGYIFRIINENEDNIDLLSMNPGSGMGVIIGKSHEMISVEYPLQAIEDWVNLRIKFLLAEDKLIFYTPDTFCVKDNVGFDKQESFKIIFGVNDYKTFKNSDVPPMSIKNISLAEKGKIRYQWLLDEEEGQVATDIIKGEKAQVINPSWLIVNHSNWNAQFEDEIRGNIAISADEEGGRIFMLSATELTIYSTTDTTARKISYVNKPRFFNHSYRAVYNSLEDRIYCYVVDDQPFFSLDVKTGEWNDIGEEVNVNTKFRHHNSYFRKADNSIYLLGGYGFHRYNNEVVKLDLTSGTRTELNVEKTDFTPRYLAGSYCYKDTIYLLGGYGSKSGNQAINPGSNFDLVAYSVNDSSFTRKFRIPRLVDDMVVANSMWIDSTNQDYYALIFSKVKSDGDLQLIRGNLNSSEIILVGNKIPFRFHDVRTTANLYYMPTVKKLFACTSYFNETNTTVKIFSIDNPPNEAPIEDNVYAEKNSNYELVLVLVVLAILGIIVFFSIRRKKKGTDATTSEEEGTDERVKIGTGFFDTISDQKEYNIILFGGFQVFNKEMEDITNKFSPLIKELFLLFQLHTFKDNKGISSNKITEVLWYDKSEKSARNNLGVSNLKLRGILEEIGPCELSQKTGYWKINYKGSSIKSDYFDFMNITASKKNLTKQKVNQLIEITKKGAFLLNVHYDWLDEFKASVSDTIIDTLVDFGQSCDVKAEADFIIHLADSVFNFDMINEDAMRLKCKAQYCMGKHSHAKATYQKFFNEYLSMYGQEYDQAFLEVLEIKE